MYAITFDLDTEMLAKLYEGDSWRNAYGDIKRILLDAGFSWQQGSVYFGDLAKIDAASAVGAAGRLARELPWFAESVRDIQMLRIEEKSDLNRTVAEQGQLAARLRAHGEKP
jgi:virulence-associated protein VapD